MLGDIIQSRMKEMGVNDKWIVAKTGLSESTVTRITGGKKRLLHNIKLGARLLCLGFVHR